MQIGATTWGQQWMPPAVEARAAGSTGRGSEVAGAIGDVRAPLDIPGRGVTGRLSPGEGSDAASGVSGANECQTCKRRRYTDRSSDPTVTFQTPTSLSPDQAATAVRAHEQQHVVHEQARARENGERVVAQSVAIHSAICPECGRSYVSGGTTTTTTKPAGSGYSSSGAGNGRSAGAFVDRRY